MLFLSQIVGRPVLDKEGDTIAAIKDVVVRLGGETYPPLVGLVARSGRRDFFIPASDVIRLDATGAKLSTYRLDLRPFARRDGEILLARDVLDKQLIDVHGRRVIRVNDLQLADVAGSYYLAGADLSPRALLRRLSPHFVADHILDGDIMDWANVEYLASEAPAVRLKVSHERIGRLHPVDVARLVDSLSYRQGVEIVEALDDKMAADILGEMTEERQADILESMSGSRAADILEQMAPDDAADALGALPERKAEEILKLMEPEESAEVKELLAYAEDTAGGLMTTEYVAVPQHLTAGEALDYLRQLPERPPHFFNVYVVRSLDEPALVGVVPLSDLVLAEPSARLDQFMHRDLKFVRPQEPAEDVAKTMAEYDLLALPVVDDHNQILGIVTIDDAIDYILPESWRRRLPKIFS